MILQFKIWAFALCAASVAAALLQMLLPKTSQQKTMATVINLFLLLCLLSPLSGIKASQDFALEPIAPIDHQIAQEGAQSLMQQEIEARISQLVIEKLQTMGIISRQVRIDITVSEDTFEINRIVVGLSASDAARNGEAEKMLTQYLGLPVTVQSEVT